MGIKPYGFAEGSLEFFFADLFFEVSKELQTLKSTVTAVSLLLIIKKTLLLLACVVYSGGLPYVKMKKSLGADQEFQRT